MIQLFRSFSWGALLPLLVAAAALWSVGAWALPAEGFAARAPQMRGAWGASWAVLAQAPYLSRALAAAAVALVGFSAAASLQSYRLANAGTLPAYVSLLLASAATVWLAPGAEILAALAMVAAAHQLYGAYRQQGDSLPVYNAGLLVGLAWLLSAPFVWMVGWGLVTLPQLRSPRGRDFLGYLLGVLTLPWLYLAYAYVSGDVSAALPQLLAGAARLPTVGGLRQNLAPLAVLTAATVLALLAYGRLTTRRPVQEQRAHRLYYTMLAFAWVTVLLAGPPADEPTVAYSPAPLLAPLSLLLGVYLLELPRKPASVLLLLATLAVLGAHVTAALAP